MCTHVYTYVYAYKYIYLYAHVNTQIYIDIHEHVHSFSNYQNSPPDNKQSGQDDVTYHPMPLLCSNVHGKKSGYMDDTSMDSGRMKPGKNITPVMFSIPSSTVYTVCPCESFERSRRLL